MTSSRVTLTVRNHDRDLGGMRYVYPVLSRRAGGVSVGINLNPNNACNWHCVYCQVPNLVRGAAPEIDLALLESELDGFLHALVHGDYLQRHAPEGAREIRDIALSGNGEPTSAAAFPEVVERIHRLRLRYGLAERVPLRLITNGSLLGRQRVRGGIRRMGEVGGEVWFKVDGGRSEDVLRINGVRRTPERMARDLARCAELCATWVQTCMFRWDGESPSAEALTAYLDVLERANAAGRLRGVLLYGVARTSMQPEAPRVSPLPAAELEAIAGAIRKKGLTVTVSP
ncbi:radical SAM protein [Pseudothauera nasutitermitis]|uniref:Radical SAM protein n=1 Tax=Pseudothauera nasutitermitis TaxID=2565930 RepID=A0A4S4AP63_9RHOO|nr:radical SAM protein [Pseudothauera nasutitermitis]THF61441.1 radical SAM protein [Pseudothauera nasutitermitis]